MILPLLLDEDDAVVIQSNLHQMAYHGLVEYGGV